MRSRLFSIHGGTRRWRVLSGGVSSLRTWAAVTPSSAARAEIDRPRRRRVALNSAGVITPAFELFAVLNCEVMSLTIDSFANILRQGLAPLVLDKPGTAEGADNWLANIIWADGIEAPAVEVR